MPNITLEEIKDWKDFYIFDNKIVIPNWSVNNKRGYEPLYKIAEDVGIPVKEYFEQVIIQSQNSKVEEIKKAMEKLNRFTWNNKRQWNLIECGIVAADIKRISELLHQPKENKKGGGVR